MVPRVNNKAVMKPQARSLFFSRLREKTPHPTTELRYRNHFQLLIAVILSAQSTDRAVNEATPALFKKAGTPQAMVRLGVNALRGYIRTIGLFNTKARNIISTCQQLLDKHGGRVPERREELEKLPGVGRKTANVVLNTAFGEETIAVDTHVFRVANRTRLAPGSTPLAVEKALMEAVPPEFRRHAHHWLIEHGRYTCRAKVPLCHQCAVYTVCLWPDKNKQKRTSGK